MDALSGGVDYSGTHQNDGLGGLGVA